MTGLRSKAKCSQSSLVTPGCRNTTWNSPQYQSKQCPLYAAIRLSNFGTVETIVKFSFHFHCLFINLMFSAAVMVRYQDFKE